MFLQRFCRWGKSLFKKGNELFAEAVGMLAECELDSPFACQRINDKRVLCSLHFLEVDGRLSLLQRADSNFCDLKDGVDFNLYAMKLAGSLEVLNKFTKSGKAH